MVTDHLGKTTNFRSKLRAELLRSRCALDDFSRHEFDFENVINM